MRILTNVSKAELDYLTNQPTAKAMIEKVKIEGIYIPEGDAQGAAEFVAMRNNQKQEAYLQISDEGMMALKKEKEAKENTSQEDQMKEKIAELESENQTLREEIERYKNITPAGRRKLVEEQHIDIRLIMMK